MPESRERQVSFVAGELSPTLHGRTDIAAYQAGARTMKNFFVDPHGPAHNRAGTQHIATLPNDVDVTKTSLYGFRYSATTKALLVLSNLWVRAYSGARFKFTLDDTAPGVGGVRPLSISQEGKILTIAGPGLNPTELELEDAGTWKRTFLGFFAHPYYEQIGESVAVRYLGAPYTVQAKRRRPLLLVEGSDFLGSASRPARLWEWAVTHLIETDKGEVYETSPKTLRLYAEAPSDGYAAGEYPYTNTLSTTFTLSRLPAKVAVYADIPARIWLGTPEGTAEHVRSVGGGVAYYTGNTIIGHRVYRGRDGRYGLLGETTGAEFEDDGSTPDFSNPPPQSYNPFSAHGLPSVCAFYEGRLYFGAASNKPNRVYGSSVEQWTNFDEVIVPDDSDALQFVLTGESEKVKAMVAAEQLRIFTTTGEWVARGYDSGALTPNSIDTKKLSKHGSGDLQPLQIGHDILFLRSRGTRPMIQRRDGTVVDISVLSRHLFDGHTIVDWDYAEIPYGVVWAVRDDGVVLSWTYLPEQQVSAWCRHVLAGDAKRVASLPEGNEDGVYLLVDYDGTLCFERLAYRQFTDIRDAIFTDRTVTYDGAKADSVTVADTYSSGGVIGGEVEVVLDASHTGLQGRYIQIDTADDDVPLRLQLGAESPAGTYRSVVHRRDFPSSLLGTAITGWWLCATSLSGLEHLEGQEVVVVADGAVVEGLTVSGGSCSWESVYGPAAITHVGLAREDDFESLDAMRERGRQKNVKTVGIELEHSRGCYVGQSLDGPLEEVPVRKVSEGYLVSPLDRTERNVPIRSQWGKSGRCVVRQTAPMPVTILGITREIEYGGR